MAVREHEVVAAACDAEVLHRADAQPQLPGREREAMTLLERALEEQPAGGRAEMDLERGGPRDRLDDEVAQVGGLPRVRRRRREVRDLRRARRSAELPRRDHERVHERDRAQGDEDDAVLDAPMSPRAPPADLVAPPPGRAERRLGALLAADV